MKTLTVKKLIEILIHADPDTPVMTWLSELIDDQIDGNQLVAIGQLHSPSGEDKSVSDYYYNLKDALNLLHRFGDFKIDD